MRGLQLLFFFAKFTIPIIEEMDGYVKFEDPLELGELIGIVAEDLRS